MGGQLITLAACILALSCCAQNELVNGPFQRNGVDIDRIISEESAIKRIFIKQFSKGEHCLSSSKELNGIANFFRDSVPSIEPCLQTSIYYSGNIADWRNGVPTCENNLIDTIRFQFHFKEQVDSLIELEMTSAWINANQPFSEKYSLLQIGDGRKIDMRKWSDRVRIMFISKMLLEVEFYPKLVDDQDPAQIVWISDSTNSKLLKVFQNPEVDKDRFVDSSLSVSLNLALELLLANRDAEHQIVNSLKNSRSPFVNLNVEYINLNKLCGLCSECDDIFYCATRINRLMNDFLQDAFHIRYGGNDSFNMNISTVDDLDLEAIEFLKTYTEKVCSSDVVERDSLSATSGGNMFVMDNVVFIGADEIDNYKIKKHQKLLGLPDSFSIDNLEDQIKYHTFKKRDDSVNLVWIGTADEQRFRYEKNDASQAKKRQPIYHVDLFFNPIGVLDDEEQRRFYYLFAEIDSASCAGDSVCEGLRKWLIDSEINLAEQLRDQSFLPYPIKIPLEVTMGSGLITDYSILLNGLFNRLNKDTVQYFIPVNTRVSSVLQVEAINRISGSKISGRTLQVLQVRDSYEAYSGLRCRVKVIERQPLQ